MQEAELIMCGGPSDSLRTRALISEGREQVPLSKHRDRETTPPPLF